MADADTDVVGAESSEANNPNAAAVYMENDVAVYRASSLMSCQNLLLMARLGYDGAAPPADMQRRFDAGHVHEPLILGKYEEMCGGTPVYNRQGTVDVPVGFKALIRGHIDGMVAENIYVDSINGRRLAEGSMIFVNDVVVVDAKALSQAGFEKWKSNQWRDFPYYLWQQYIYAMGFDAAGVLMAVKNKNTDEHVFDYWEFDAMPLNRADVIQRVLMIEKLAERGEEALFENPCNPVSYPCPFFMFHPEDDGKIVIKDKDVEGGLERLEALVARREDVVQRIKDAEAEQADIDDEIRRLYGEQEATAKLDWGTLTVYRSTYRAFDWTALSADLGKPIDDLKEAYNLKVLSPKLSVRATKRKEK
jgi:hypothetical protein